MQARPRSFYVSMGFGKDNGGAIAPKLLQIPNSESNGAYLQGCKALGTMGHPARFPAKFPEFFVRMLTDPNDLVVDIFGGSNTTGYVAEVEGRRWLTFEADPEYLAAASAFRFLPSDASKQQLKEVYEQIVAGRTVDLSAIRPAQTVMLG